MRIPKYCLHKATGQAYVNLDGRRTYLGRHGSEESQERYRRLVRDLTAKALPTMVRPGEAILVVELCNAYRKHAEEYFGESPSSLDRIRVALRILRDNFGRLPVDEFGPLALQTVQKNLVAEGLSRTYINHLSDCIRRVFRWGASQEIVPVVTYQALTTVPGLRRGRTAAAEPEPVQPVADSVVDATIAEVQPIVGDLIRFQRYTGCRPGEAVLVRPMDLDRAREVWEFRPQSHKTAYRGKERVVYIGPKAQAVLMPYLLRPSDAYCFSPAEAKDAYNAARGERRRSPMTPSQRARKRKKKPQRAPGDHYTVNTYRQQIRRAVERVNAARKKQAEEAGIPLDEVALLPDWRPNQLRHAAGTEVRKAFGLEGAQVVLGHSHAQVTEVYAERNADLARTVAMKIG